MEEIFYWSGATIWAIGGIAMLVYLICLLLFNCLKYAGLTKNLIQFWVWQRKQRTPEHDNV